MPYRSARRSNRVNEMSFKELFSKQANDYARFRPTYPEDLFGYLASLTEEHSCAWDCGTGNGQAAIALAHYYDRVIGTDPSADQIAHARPHPKVEYRIAPAEDSAISAERVALIVVAQALHWFDLDKFYAEVQRVAKPSGSIIAVWCYGLMEITPAVDQIISRYYHNVIGKYWEPERQLVEQGYRGIPFPFHEIATPEFLMEATWTFNHFLGYLNTWSATQAAIRSEGVNPLGAIRTELCEAWGHVEMERQIRWPLFVRVGSIRKI